MGEFFIFKEEIGALILIRLMNNKWEGIALPQSVDKPWFRFLLSE